MTTPMTTYPIPSSSCIHSLAYTPLTPEQRSLPFPIPDYANGLLLISFQSDRSTTYAYLIPSWVVGLLLSGSSLGSMYHRLVRDRYPSFKIATQSLGSLQRELSRS